ncbi:MAG TPA: FlgD immunoglobulin-like domain containing protein, partial [Frankiaceae bacterium]|nr:FlgD immunoglobulin-like domain containing protein [Frankiaceae bacterium]
MSRSAFLAVALATGLATLSHAQAVVYQQPHDGSGQVMKSAWYPPDGLDGDEYVYDSFVLGAGQAVTAIAWRGGYTNFLSGAGESPVFDFTVSILPSIGGGSQPDILAAPLARYSVGGNAGETPAGTFSGVPLYDYSFTLPAAFMATAGTTYWVQIEASQGLTPYPYYWPPDWSLARGTGGNGTHFRAITGGTAGGGTLYQTVSYDAAFSLLSATAATCTIAADVAPPGAGTVSGAGPYPAGATAALQAAANAGFGFVDWTEGGVTVSNSPNYSFTVAGDRTLVANFTPAYTVTTASTPLYGGATTGDGVYNLGSAVTVTATPDTGFTFSSWTELGTTVSVSASYGFTAGADRALVAHFTPLTPSALFDFDTGYPTLGTGAGLPFSQLVNGVTAYVSSPQGNAFSVQTDGSTGWRMAWFSGHYLSDNNLNRNALDILFSHQLSGIYLTFATADFNQGEVPTTLLLTAYENSPASPAVGTATAHGAYIGSTMPMGTLSFNSAAPFDMVELVLPYQPLGCTDFFVDDIMVALQHPAAVPPGPPAATLLLAPAPNPSRGTTRIAFDLADAGAVRVAVFDLSGRRVARLADGAYPAGRHTLTWDGRDAGGAQAAAGAYFVRFEGGGR